MSSKSHELVLLWDLGSICFSHQAVTQDAQAKIGVFHMKALNQIMISTKAERKSCGASETKLRNSSLSSFVTSLITEAQVSSSQT